ncbi:MAG: AhpC/TSA family protein [Gelidibacter sp.]|nr:AhpC/TSA family protein [Gelidibacter sp.]
MKKLFCLLLISSLAFSCNDTVKESDGYVIKGTAKDVYNGVRAYLVSNDQQGREVYQDTAMVVDEKFEFKGKVDVPQMWHLNVNGVVGNMPIMIENGEITVTLDKKNINNSKVTGTKSNDALTAYTTGFMELSEKRRKMNLAIRDAAIPLDTPQSSESAALNNEISNYPFTFIESHNDNHFSLKLVESLVPNTTVDLDKIEKGFNALDESLKNSELGKVVSQKITERRATQERLNALNIGGTAPNFTAPSTDGSMLSLNDIKGKVTIIDFWASWCGPCRRENPNVVKVYNKYHDKGLEIISVSLDRPGQKDKWLKAIEADKLTWHHVSNLNYFNDPVARLYDIQSIPSTFILDSEGKIVAKKLRGQALEDKIAELLN